MGYRVLRLSTNILVFWVAEFQAEISEDWSLRKLLGTAKIFLKSNIV
jgi:hypothetical protein